MAINALYFILLFGILLVLELVYFKIADQCNIIDKPNQRSSHTSITLRGGGIIFYIGALLYFLISGFQYPFFMLGLTLVAGISFIDDIRSASRTWRLLIHLFSVSLMFYEWGLYTNFPNWYIPIALVICIGVINAYNFMDGINGMTGGYSLILLLTLSYVNCFLDYVDTRFLLIMIIAVLVFCIFNFKTNAKCFAGDVGSISIAFIIIFFTGKLILKTFDFTYIIFFCIYGVDSVMTIIHRIILKENIFEAHRMHIYQILANECKWGHMYVSLLYMSLQSIVNYGYFVINPSKRYLYLTFSIVLFSVLYLIFIKIIKKKNDAKNLFTNI